MTSLTDRFRLTFGDQTRGYQAAEGLQSRWNPSEMENAAPASARPLVRQGFAVASSNAPNFASKGRMIYLVPLEDDLMPISGPAPQPDVGTGDLCADGSRWPTTAAELEQWCARVAALPSLFDTEAETAAFEARLISSRRDQAVLIDARDQRVASLFE